MRHSLRRPALAALLSMTSGAALAQQIVSAPSVSAAPNVGHPYNAAAYQKVPQNLGASGYVEAEYLLSGNAQAYAYTAPFTPYSESVALLPGGAVPYVNRILVRAPADPTKFSGNVIVEIINDALVADNTVQWPYATGRFTANGDVWIGMTSQSGALAALRSYSPARYGTLSWPALPAASGCDTGKPEDGLIYDQITALGKLIRQPASLLNPGGVYHVKAVYLTAYSAASQILLTYNRVFDPQNAGLWDAYMVSSGGLRATLNACENKGSSPTQQPAYYRPYGPASTTAAVMQTQTISETGQGVTVPTSGNDSNASNNRYRYYDLAGASHVNDDLVHAQPNANDLAAAGALNYTQGAATTYCDDPGPLSDFPNRYVYDALWTNLEGWVRNGTIPPSAPKMNYSESTGGTPVGGVRTPGVDAPLFTYYGGHAANSQYPQFSTVCSVTGYEIQIPMSQLVNMYGTVNGYVAAVQKAAQADAAAGYLTPTDEANIMNHPTSSAGY